MTTSSTISSTHLLLELSPEVARQLSELQERFEEWSNLYLQLKHFASLLSAKMNVAEKQIVDAQMIDTSNQLIVLYDGMGDVFNALHEDGKRAGVVIIRLGTTILHEKLEEIEFLGLGDIWDVLDALMEKLVAEVSAKVEEAKKQTFTAKFKAMGLRLVKKIKRLSTGKDSTREDSTGEDSSGQDSSGQDSTVQGSTGKDST